ncbi:MAG TPA: AMIN domain-containing protein [Methylomirabilota bacterium]|nr:AMIN domain-containing protein [Methylomirabilota bacterium]
MTAPRMRPLAWLLAAALALAAVPVAAQEEPPALTEATIVDREGALEVWVRLTRPARYQAELIDSPDRLVVDFQDTVYRWRLTPVPVTLDPVRALRGSQFRRGVARLVIELRRRVPYTIEQDREGLRIVLSRVGASSRATPPPAPAGPIVYGIVILDQDALAYIFDPASREVRRYRVGDTLADGVIEAIAERHVVLRTPGGRQELRVDATKPGAPSRPR